MKILQLNISNILSFWFDDESWGGTCIELDGWLNVITWPNGSGKSNFLEIIQQLLSVWIYKSYIIDIWNLKSLDNTKRKKTIRRESNNERTESLKPHWDHENLPMQLKVSIFLNKEDIDNIIYLQSIKEIINEYILKYCTEDVVIDWNWEMVEKLILEYTIWSNWAFNLNGNINLSIQYLQYFNLFQQIINVYNTVNSIQLNQLKNTFSMIPSYRNYHSLNMNISANQNEFTQEQNIFLESRRSHVLSTSDQKNIPWFEYYKIKLAHLWKRGLLDKGKNNIMPAIENSLVYKDLNKYLLRSLWYSLDIQLLDIDSWSFVFSVNRDGKSRNIESLSSWEKWILYLLFSLFWYDLNNGIVIIDEPEIHLHPPLMKRYLKILQEITHNLWTQIIIVTHNQYFMPIDQLDAIKRFVIINHKTEVYSLQKLIIDQEQLETLDKNKLWKLKKELSKEDQRRKKLFTFENREIFFSKYVIVVEWIDDRYILRKYIWDNEDFFVMNWLNQFETTENILADLEIKSYAIVDLDYLARLDAVYMPNLSSSEIESFSLIRNLEQLAKSEKKPQVQKAYYKTLDWLRKEQSFMAQKMVEKMSVDTAYKQLIEDKINELESSNIFVLNGSIEDYIDKNQNILSSRKNEIDNILNKIKA